LDLCISKQTNCNRTPTARAKYPTVAIDSAHKAILTDSNKAAENESIKDGVMNGKSQLSLTFRAICC